MQRFLALLARLARSLTALGFCFAVVIASAGSAQADLYWASWANQSIDAVELSGGTTAVLVPGAGTNLTQVTVGSNGYIYWADYSANQIGRAKIDGTDANPAWLVGATEPTGLATTATHIYWSEDGGNRVARAAIDGSNIEPNFITGLSGPHGLSIQGNNLFIANTAADELVRANLTTQQVDILATVTGPQMVATNSSHIFWTNFRGESVGRANLDGSSPNPTFITAAGSWTYGVAVDSQYVYWTNYAGGHSIGRAMLDGTDPTENFVADLSWPAGLAVVSDPTVAAVTPSSGGTAGGTNISLTGSGFFADTVVTVGGAPCVNPTWVDQSTINCLTPPGNAGEVSVVVTNPDGNTATAPTGFTYANPPPTPPTPVTPLHVAQKPVNACAQAPRTVPKVGAVRLLKPGCVTSAGQPVRVRVTTLDQRGLQNRGDFTYYKVVRKPNGRTTLKTQGHRVTLRVTWSAKATRDQSAYKKVRTYRL